MTKNYTTNVGKLVSFDYDGSMSSAKLSMSLIPQLIEKKLLDPGCFVEASRLYSRYLNDPSPKNYGNFSVSVIELIGKCLKGKKTKKVKDFTKNYAKNSRALWMDYTQDLITLFNYFDYTKAAITGMPEELAFPLSEEFGINTSRVYASSYEVENGLYTGKTKNVYSLNGSKGKKLGDLYQRLGDDSLQERTVVVGDTAEDPFMSARFGILLNWTGDLPGELQEKCDLGELLVLKPGPKEKVIRRVAPFLRKVDKEISAYS